MNGLTCEESVALHLGDLQQAESDDGQDGQEVAIVSAPSTQAHHVPDESQHGTWEHG